MPYNPGVDQLVCMRSFVRVADLHSFTRAADALGVSRAVVSTHVAELERHLRCQLFHRTTRRVGLTSDGAEYLARCQRILAELEAADEALRGARLSVQGRLRVDVPVVFGRALLLPALPKFTARYPDLQLEVQFNDRVIDLIAEEVDLVVRVGAVREPHLVARRVVTTRLLTCAAPEYLRAHGVPAEPEELRRHQLVGHLAAGSRRARTLRSCAAARCATRPRSGCSPTLPPSCCCSTGDAWTRCWIEAPLQAPAPSAARASAPGALRQLLECPQLQHRRVGGRQKLVGLADERRDLRRGQRPTD